MLTAWTAPIGPRHSILVTKGKYSLYQQQGDDWVIVKSGDAPTTVIKFTKAMIIEEATGEDGKVYQPRVPGRYPSGHYAIHLHEEDMTYDIELLLGTEGEGGRHEDVRDDAGAG